MLASIWLENFENSTKQYEDAIAWLEKQSDKDKIIKELGKYKVKIEITMSKIVLEDFNEGNGYYKVNLAYLNMEQVEEIETLVSTWKPTDEDIKSCIQMCLTDANEHKFKDYGTNLKDCLAWLEKQGQQDDYDDNIITHDDEILQAISIGLTDAEKDLGWSDFGGLPIEEIHAWLEKQGEQEQLYIRFGEIPTDEKSKIFQGEIEIGTENGVSVYPAFKTSEGDIVLGLSLPITKTTLYTQQHLIEYDDRPCYLVKGDYVGKDTDGQPLINNVSIIEKIDTYRVKEKKQDNEPKASYTTIVETGDGGINALVTKELPIDKVEPKFHKGEWIVWQNKCYKVNYNGCGYELIDQNGLSTSLEYGTIDENAHLWDIIKDAKDGDILVNGSNIFIFSHLSDTRAMGYCHINLDDGRFYDDKDKTECFGLIDTVFSPATEEQRNLLFAKMKEAGYQWDAENKELKKIEQNLASSEKTCKNDTLLDLLQKMPSYITLDGILYHFMLRKTTISYMAFYEGEGEGSGKVIFWVTAYSPIELLTAMLEKLKKEGLLE